MTYLSLNNSLIDKHNIKNVIFQWTYAKISLSVHFLLFRLVWSNCVYVSIITLLPYTIKLLEMVKYKNYP